MHTVICIRPSSGDVWTSTATSPFSNLALGGSATGFILSNLPSTQSSLTTAYTLAPSRLMGCSTLHRSIDIFSAPEFDGSKRIVGVGGLEATADITVTLENSAHTIRLTKLIGRKIQIYVNSSDATIRDPGHANNLIRFTGYIYSADGKRENVGLTCRGTFQAIKDTEIGTLSNYENDVFRSEIIPIVYGDFTDSLGFMPASLNRNVGNLPDLIFSEQELTQLNSLLAYDAEAQKEYTMNLAGLTVNATLNQIQLQEATGLFLTNGCLATDTLINVWNPGRIRFIFDTVATPLRVKTSLIAGSKYTDSHGKIYECLTLIDTVTYEFTMIEGWTELALGDTLTYVSGAGTEPATLTLVAQFGFQSPELELQGIENENYSSASTDLIGTKPKTQIFKIDDEQLFIRNRTVVETANAYVYDTFVVIRGFNDTTEAIHSAFTTCSKIEAAVGKISCQHIFWPTNITTLSSIDKDADSQIRFTNLDNEINISGKLDCLTRRGRAGLDLTTSPATSGDSISISFTRAAMSSSNYNAWLILLGLEFPKVSIDGQIINIWLVGAFGSVVNNLSLDTSTSQFRASAGISLIKGFGALPFFETPSTFNPRNSDLEDILGIEQCTNLAMAGHHQKYPDSSSTSNLRTTYSFVSGGTTYNIRTDFLYTNWDLFSHTDIYARPRCISFSGHIQDCIDSEFVRNIYRVKYTSDFNNLGLLLPSFTQQQDLRAYSVDCSSKDIQDGNLGYSAMVNQISELNSARLALALTGFGNSNLSVEYNLNSPGLLVHFTIDPLKTRVYARGQGIKASGSLLSDPVSQMKNLIETYVKTSIFGSSWTTQITKYLTTENLETSWQVTGKPQKCSQIIDPVCRENLLAISENGQGLLEVESLIPPSSAPSVTLLDSDILMNDNVTEVEEGATDLSQITTKLSLRYQKNYAAPEVYGSLADVTNVPTGEEVFAETETILDYTQDAHMDMDTVRKSSTANKLFLYQGTWHNKAFNVYSFSVKWATVVVNSLRSNMWVNITSAFLPNSASSYYYISTTEEQFPMNDSAAQMKLTVIEIPSNSYATIDDYTWQDTETVYGNDNDINDIVTSGDDVQDV